MNSPLAISFEVAIAATCIAASIGVLVGRMLASKRMPMRDLFDVAFTSPLVLPPTVLGYYMLSLVGRGTVLGRAFEAVTGSPLVFTRAGAIFAASLGATPIVVKSARAAFEATDPRLVLAARTLGASRLRAFSTVTLPLAHRPIVAATGLAFARSLGDFGLTLMIAGDLPGETRTASLAIYAAAFGGREREAGEMAFVLGASACALLYLSNRWGRPAA